jgi:hypothetical protein
VKIATLRISGIDLFLFFPQERGMLIDTLCVVKDVCDGPLGNSTSQTSFTFCISPQVYASSIWAVKAISSFLARARR